MEPRPPSASHSVLTRWMGVLDANLAGNVHGGAIMKLCDEVAGIAAWRTSMEVGVRVESEEVRSGTLLHTSTAYLTMVALDDDGRPAPVPAVAPETADEKRRQREAQLRRDNRLAERDQIVAGRG